MPPARFDVLAIGNAIVDVISPADDGFLERHGLVKDSMDLVDIERSEAIYADMGPGVEASGGSAANTAVGVAALGGRAAFVGRVRDDQLGAVFTHDIRAAGVHFQSRPATSGPSTARCLILVTPDASRTMNTYLGAASELGIDEIDDELVASAAITYCEGYLWDRDGAKAAIRHAADVARRAGRQVALTLSDGFCVERHRDEFNELIAAGVDILFANEAEICSLYEVDQFDDALQAVRTHVPLAFLTRGATGAVVVRGEEVHVVGAHPQGAVIDTTGAGDAFAAGALRGLTSGAELATCARIGAIAAGEVISHVGPRPGAGVRELVERALAV